MTRVLVVHGHRRRGDAEISRECRRRVRTAADFVRSRKTDWVVFSGRGLAGLGHYSEALRMRAEWARLGMVASDAMPVTESRSSSTEENAAEAGALARDLGATEVVICTSFWHVPRAWFLWRRSWPSLRISMLPVLGSVRYIPGELRAVFRLWRSWTRG